MTPGYGDAALESAVRELRALLMALAPEDALEWARGGGAEPDVSHPHLAKVACVNESVAMRWQPPARVDLVGSYLLRTAARPALNLDLALEIPGACLLSKDYLDGRYDDKRLLYLSHLADALSAQTQSGSASSPPLLAAEPALEYLPHHASAKTPVLSLTLTAVPGWRIRLIPTLAADSFPPAKLAPTRCNLRDGGGAGGGSGGGMSPAVETPSRLYNNRLALESGYRPALALLHAHLAKDKNGTLREAPYPPPYPPP